MIIKFLQDFQNECPYHSWTKGHSYLLQYINKNLIKLRSNQGYLEISLQYFDKLYNKGIFEVYKIGEDGSLIETNFIVNFDRIYKIGGWINW